MLEIQNNLEFGVKPKEFVVETSFRLDALNLSWLGVIGGSPLHGL